jgi:hypothetical protein
MTYLETPIPDALWAELTGLGNTRLSVPGVQAGRRPSWKSSE